MKQKLSLLLLLQFLFIFGGCRATLPVSVLSRAERDAARYPVRIHSLSAGGTDITVIFDTDKTILIDCSKNRDSALITDYLRSQGVFRLQLVLLPSAPGESPYPDFPAAEIIGADTLDLSREIPLSFGVIRFSRAADETINAVFHHHDSNIFFPLCVSEVSASDASTASVLVQNPSPDGVQTEIAFVPLREMMEGV